MYNEQNKEWYETYSSIDQIATDMRHFIRSGKFAEAEILLKVAPALYKKFREDGKETG